MMYGIILIACVLVCAQNSAGETELSEVTANLENDTAIIKTQQVDFGKTAVLICHSNDRDHFFLFWQLAKDDVVVGPGNQYDDLKYDYEILSGSLIIREVSTNEAGIYHCVSRGVKSDDINIRSVRMIVIDDYVDPLAQHDPGVYYFRAVVIVISLMIVAVAIYIAYKMKRRHRLQGLLDESDEEDSAEEIFRAPGTSRGTTGNIVLDKADEPAEIPKISIDFEDILNNSNK